MPTDVPSGTEPATDALAEVTDDSDRADAAPASDAGATEASPDATPLPDSDVAAVAAGRNHSCAIRRGELWCWGDNSSGQLGLGDAANRERPTLVDGDNRFIALGSGATHSCAIDYVGQVWCWGGNEHGQLGQGDRQSRAAPVPVPLPASGVELSSDSDHSCVRSSTGSVYCWGSNREGQLGLDDAYPANDESAADALSPVSLGAWSNVDTGQGHSCGIGVDGSLWCWGRNTAGQLANDEGIQFRAPARVGNDNDWLRVDAGQGHSCGLRAAGSLWCWGVNDGLATGDGAPFGVNDVEQSYVPVRVGSASSWTELSTDTFHSCGLQGEALWCWGRNIEGQLGLGDLDLRDAPTRVEGSFSMVSVARFHTCAVTGSGDIACTGANDDGKLGTGDGSRRNRFTVVLPAN